MSNIYGMNEKDYKEQENIRKDIRENLKYLYKNSGNCQCYTTIEELESRIYIYEDLIVALNAKSKNYVVHNLDEVVNTFNEKYGDLWMSFNIMEGSHSIVKLPAMNDEASSINR